MSSGRGFTLIELLLVCSLLAAVSLLAWGAYAGVDQRAKDELARAELLRLASALRRFHDDTGYWPGQGPFRLNTDCNAMSNGSISAASVPSEVSNDDRAAWFHSPANMSLLFEAPEMCSEHPLSHLATWDDRNHRGWHGPYLPLGSRRWVDVWKGLELETTKNASPETSNNNADMLAAVPAFGAGPDFPPVDKDYAACAASSACFLGWSGLPGGEDEDDDNDHRFSRHPRPFIFLLSVPSGSPSGVFPRVVYWGADGRYGGVDTNTDPCLPSAHSDDVVICL
ncbi:MAG: prepilin-type N-terminal cleavage/methylation domain-containing protein [Zoogloeaceae bacterium]|nr:prepilin-type N-terminal cleavage/methylation domain-containing protein [Zoogloeaceae bacterium]